MTTKLPTQRRPIVEPMDDEIPWPPEPDEIPWSRLGKRACPAVAADRQVNANGTTHIEPIHCDLVRGHRDAHRAERGMYDLLWDDVLRTG